MKNRHQNVSKISDEKFRLLIKYFCKDFTVLQIADLLHINRNTASLWVNRIRQRIYELVEEERMSNSKSVQMDETYFTKAMEYYPKYKFPYQEIVVFGIINEQGKVYAKIVDKANKREVFPIIQQCCAKNATIFTDSAALYEGLSKLGYQHYFVNHVDKIFSKYIDDMCITTNRIEGFRGWMKVRFAKFRGIKWDNLPLHIAESVWRFNHRQDDIYLLLLAPFRANKL